MQTTLKGLERILGRRLKVLGMSAFTTSNGKFSLSLRSVEVNNKEGAMEPPHIHILKTDGKGKSNERLGKGVDIGKVELDPTDKYDSARDLKIEYKGSDTVDKTEVLRMLNSPLEDKLDESFDKQTNNEKFIEIYIDEHKNCKDFKKFDSYIKNKIEKYKNENLNCKEVANKFVDELLKIINKYRKDITRDSFKIKYDSKNNAANIKFSNFNFKNVGNKLIWDCISEAVEEATKDTQFYIERFSNDSGELEFNIYEML